MITQSLVAAERPNAQGLWRWLPLRLVFLLIVLIVLYGGAQSLLTLLATRLSDLAKPALYLCGETLVCVAIIIAYYWLIRWVERRIPAELSRAKAPRLVITGALIGVALCSTVYAVLWSLGDASFNSFGSARGVGIVAATSLAAAVAEETIFRGVVFRLLEQSTGTLIAIVVSGAFFGFAHLASPGATVISAAAIALEAGVLLAAAYALSRSLWLPIGMHFAWDFTEEGIFGSNPHGATQGLFKAHLSGPDFLSGGPFGAEASVVAIAVCLAVATVLLLLTLRYRRWKPLRLRLRSN